MFGSLICSKNDEIFWDIYIVFCGRVDLEHIEKTFIHQFQLAFVFIANIFELKITNELKKKSRTKSK